MLFIYALDPDVAEELAKKGLKKIQEVMVGERKAIVFENQKDVLLDRYEKFSAVFFTNRLLF